MGVSRVSGWVLAGVGVGVSGVSGWVLVGVGVVRVQQAKSISRGVYLLPGTLPPHTVTTRCYLGQHGNSVILFSVTVCLFSG